jgi:RNA 2',3'-cyclic 3'-phosphodiesterase
MQAGTRAARSRNVEHGEGDERQRLFVAVPLPVALEDVVRRAQDALPPSPSIRLLRPEQWHVTLAFIGEVDAAKAESARMVVEELPSHMGGEATMEQFLMLPSAARARVVTLGLTDERGVFQTLFEAVMGGLEAGGVMQREKRPFRPHLTIARLRTPGAVRPRYESERVRFAIESVCLFKSELRREGAVYTVVSRKTFDLGDADEKL